MSILLADVTFMFCIKGEYQYSLNKYSSKASNVLYVIKGKYLSNAKIAKVNQPEYERILEFYIETYNELGDKIYLCLAFEINGKTFKCYTI